MNSPVFAYKDPQPLSVEALQSELLATIEAGSPQVILDIDGLRSLDVDAIRGLITLLRRVRDAAGEVALRVTREDLKRTLSVTALDRIFTITREASGAAA
ncbi:MAG: STAS domain-containing protein [Vulcanimicrobiaceae bacterium]